MRLHVVFIASNTIILAVQFIYATKLSGPSIYVKTVRPSANMVDRMSQETTSQSGAIYNEKHRFTAVFCIFKGQAEPDAARRQRLRRGRPFGRPVKRVFWRLGFSILNEYTWIHIRMCAAYNEGTNSTEEAHGGYIVYVYRGHRRRPSK